jgi:hypothetical protein
MGYSSTDLKDSLYNMFTVQSNPNTMQQHYKDLAKIYDDYCKDSKEDGASNVLLTTGKSAFESVFSTYPESAPSLTIYATYIENACISYWNSSAFSLVNKPVGWVQLSSIDITAMGVDSMKSTLDTAFSSSLGDPTVLSTAMASIIHGASSGVSMTLTGLNASSVVVTMTALLKA